MSLNFNAFFRRLCLLVFLLLVTSLYGQDDRQNKSSESIHTQVQKEDMILSFGFVWPLALGHHVTTEAYAVKYGGVGNVWFRFGQHIWIGLEISNFDMDVKRKDLVGNYNDVNASLVAGVIGYKWYFKNDFGLLLGGGVGSAQYKNKRLNVYKFKDKGTGVLLLADLDYALTHDFGFYISGKWRHDFIKVEASGIEQHFFDADYIVWAIGVRFTL